ncbi:MAG: ribosome biogenesis GTP-binding protein YihA/YsxC [Bacteroidales bacterium]|jgi:GTP-binding protein|nr:YihA family ribosome biogenesis GTP-binding protein [Bacteroidales bacterium]MDI9575047.1 ribosome biogenesis GTP-binding protein YihA/YsxC [Bacteroidota bacterium]MDD2593498.1 ribosome biogenesis GTP-binding protein YihA/YsxC [Bacteroidales bacterium]MDD3755752.1 ribosome biogenesis GTP-binding protein YihA/YsxC [Bacteroidales bacterium]MDY0401164.1 ribosome biogenesis GTP-binding protein YihA/YsxC [Bacteroidales bacterium]
MKIKSVKYVKSCVSLTDCPKNILPEFAFVGRSNVGKSSLINALVSQKIALTSSIPGKTKTINFYLIDNKWYLVDLPGYGYAKTSKTIRKQLINIINEYLSFRSQLFLAFVLIDSSIPLQQIDIEFINNCGRYNIPIAIVLTKTDKEKKSIIQQNRKALMTELSKYWDELPPIFMTSSVKKTGIQDLLDYILNQIK